MKSGRFYKIGKTEFDWTQGIRSWHLLPEKLTTDPYHQRPTIPTALKLTGTGDFQAKRKGGEWFDLNASDISIQMLAKIV